MTQTEPNLQAELRTQTGSPACRRLRREGRIPAIIYGGPTDPVNITVDLGDAVRLVRSPSIAVLDISDDDSRHVLVKDTQWDYLKDQLLHIDFREIRMDQKIQTSVPLVTIGDPAGSSEGGVLDQAVHELEIECLPADLPEKIEMDVSALGVGDHFILGQLTLPEGIEAVEEDSELLLANVYIPRLEEEAEPAEGEEGELPEGEEGALEEGEEGAAESGEESEATPEE